MWGWERRATKRISRRKAGSTDAASSGWNLERDAPVVTEVVGEIHRGGAAAAEQRRVAVRPPARSGSAPEAPPRDVRAWARSLDCAKVTSPTIAEHRPDIACSDPSFDALVEPGRAADRRNGARPRKQACTQEMQ